MNIFYSLKKDRKIVYVCIGMFVWGFVMMFLVPTWQIPDENTHLHLIGSALGNESMAEQLEESISIQQGRIEFNPEEKVIRDEQIESMTEEPEYTYKEMLPKAISLNIIKYFPSIIGMEIGVLLGVPAYWVLQLGELFSLLFYVGICYKALKIMPIKKEVMALIMLFPMALQQAGSISYDAVVLPLCFYYIAYIFYLKFDKKEIVFFDFLRIVVLIGVITFIKVPYMLFTLLILVLPLDKVHVIIGKLEINQDFIRKWRGLFIIAGGIGLIFLTVVFKDNKWVQIVYGMFVEWRRSIYLILQTFKVWFEFLYTSLVGNFGWLDTPITKEYAVFVLVIVGAAAMIRCEGTFIYSLKKFDYLVIAGTGIGLTFLTMLSMVNHTIMITLYGAENINATYEIRNALYQIPYIGGLQGRYFLPFVLLFFMLLPPVKQIKKNRMYVGLGIFESVTFMYTIYVIVCRFWLG